MRAARTSTPSLLAWLDTPAACVLVAIVALTLFTCGLMARTGFDPSTFIVAGDRYVDVRQAPPGVRVLPHADGYDGQFYYRFALDPFTSKTTDFGVTLDNPPYRHQRFLYPLIVHCVSMGDARFVPIAMVATNFVFFCLLAWIAGSLARSSNRHALWGLLIVGYPGFLVTYSRDLVEIVEATFLLASVWLIRGHRPRRATLALTLAVLTRETSLIFAVSGAAVLAADRLRARTTVRLPWSVFVVPIAGFGLLQLALSIDWGRLPIRAGNPVLGRAPLAGFTESLTTTDAGQRLFQIVALGFVVLATASIVHHLFVTRADRTERLACLLYGVLMAAVGPLVWIEDIAFLRVFTQFYVFGAIVVIASRANHGAVALSLLAGSAWIFAFYRLGAAGGIAHWMQRVVAGA